MSNLSFIRTAAALTCAASLAACGGGGGGSDDNLSSTTGQLTLALTDAPVEDVNQVQVFLTGARLKPAGGTVVEIDFPDQLVDLKTLQGETSVQLFTGETVPAGEYEWIALEVDQSQSYVIIEENGGQEELRIPSGDQQGLRLVSGFTVTANQTNSFILDWDLRKALTNPVGQAGYFLRPALRITDMTQWGTLRGTVSESLLEAADDPATALDERCNNDLASDTGNLVYVFEAEGETVVVTADDIEGQEDDPLTTGVVAMDSQAAGAYTYSIPYLAPGWYTVAFTCQGISDDPETDDTLVFVQEQNARVVDGEATEVDFE